MALPGVPPIEIPASFTVWAASDIHGQLDAVDRLLAAAGLSDGGERWIAPPGTALVITGDIVDRGPASVALVRRLVALRDQAPGRGGLVALLEGNHEVQVLGGLAGEPDIFRAFLTFGGGATLRSAGFEPGEWEGMTAAQMRARTDELAPDLRPALGSFAPHATWGDVLFVHGGPVPFLDLVAFEAGAERLWIREAFSASEHPFPAADAWAAYREAGIGRVVYGHTPVPEPALGHEGRILNLDTWRSQRVTLARLEPGRPFAEATFLSEPAAPRAIADAPVSPEEVRVIDAAMPAVVKAWWASLAGAARG